MVDDKKASYPLMPTGHWWTLRKKFQKSIPGIVTDSYIASVLNMKEASARTNILPSLRQVNIIDENGKTKERAKQWRDDAQYNKVCSDIIKEVYPQELLDACPDPILDKESAERWFANHTGSGQVAVRKMVSFYSLLSDANPEKATEQKAKTKNAKESKKSFTKQKASKQGTTKPNVEDKRQHIERSSSVPSMNINLQIHISADASPDQIDKIFESMAKYVYHRKTVNE